MTLRNEKVRKALMREISQIIRTVIQDPRLKEGIISVTDVEMSHDNSFAKVFFSILSNEYEKKKLFEILESHKNKIRYELGKRVRLRLTPDLRFYKDESLERGMKITELIDKISKGEID